MNPEQIVRALAAAEPSYYAHGDRLCACCGRHIDKGDHGHIASCPWRLAVEYVARDARVEGHLTDAEGHRVAVEWGGTVDASDLRSDV